MPTEAAVKGSARKWRVKNIVFAIVFPLVFIAGSGRLDWVAGWIYIALAIAGPVATYVLLSRRWPDLLVERSSLQRGTKQWDKVLAPLVAGVFPLAMLIVSALDTRYGWSDIGLRWQVAGFAANILGIAMMLWAMWANRFFAGTVRIQKERGQTVVSSGPYAYVRHPGYVGMLANMLGTPAALDSLYAFIPGGLCAAALILRTALEDRTLKAELDGYRDYAQRVRARLVPLVW